MRLAEFFSSAISTGIKNDLRGVAAVRRELKARQKQYDDLKDEDKEYFDLKSLENPYADSRILYGQGDTEIKGVLVGIDIEGPEVMLAHAMRQRGDCVDLMLGHHPEGSAFAALHDVMDMQSEILGRMGVPINVAESLMDKRITEVQRRLHPVNHTRSVDAARIMDIPFACTHTPADNMVATYLQRLFNRKKPHKVSDVLSLLHAIPEYKDARLTGAGPQIFIGTPKRTAGRIFVDMTGGTGGSKEIFESLKNSGINTIIGMHIGEDHKKEAEKHHVNVIIAGHIASDTLGMNLLLDTVIGKKKIKVHDCSGFRRISRLPGTVRK